jgi:hypothetical protein
MSAIVMQPYGYMVVGFRPRSLFVYNRNLRNSDTIEVFKTLAEADKKAFELEAQQETKVKWQLEHNGIKIKRIEYLVVAINGVVE